MNPLAIACLTLLMLRGGEQPSAAAAFKDASSLQNAGKFTDAAAKWKQFLKDYPDDPALGLVYQGLGACLLETGDWPNAIDSLQQALKRLPKGESGISIRWNLAIGFHRQAEQTKKGEHRKQAAEAFGAILADKETSPQRLALATLYLARTEQALGNTPQAQKLYESLLKKTKDKDVVAPAVLALASIAEDAKDWPKARGYYQDFLRDFPQHESADDARLGMADVLMHQGNLNEAETLFGQLAAKKALNAADYAHFRWAELAELKGDFKTAAQRWTGFLNQHSKSPLRERGQRRAGEVHFRLKDHKEAAAVFADWLKENPKHEAHAATQVQFGLTLIQLDKHADAEAQLSNALKQLKDGDVRNQALLGLARCTVKLDRSADALKHYSDLLASKSAITDADAIRLEAVIAAFTANDSKLALDWTDQLVRKFAKSPPASQAQLQAARFLIEKGQFEEGLNRSKWVLDAKQADSQPPALYMAGFCSMKLRKFDDAITYFATLRDQHPKAEQAAVASFNIGVAHESMGARSKAIAAYQDFLKRHPNHSLANSANQRIKILQDNP